MSVAARNLMRSGQMPLLAADQVRELDRRAIARDVDGFTLMRRASGTAWRWLKARWPGARNLTVFCGSGNNGGDGHVLAALAAQEGRRVQRYSLVPRDRLSGDALKAAQMADEAGVEWLDWRSDAPIDGEVIVDAMLGTGFQGELRASYVAVIEAINGTGCPVLAIDIPSGVNADGAASGAIAIKADVTVTFIADKLGLYTGSGAAHSGEVVVEPLGLDAMAHDDITPIAWRLTPECLAEMLPPRPRGIHKGALGFAGIIGGAPGYGGAALLAAEACARVGAGRVMLATAPEHVTASLVRCPEVMARGLIHATQLPPLLEPLNVLAIGPGLGQSSWGQAMLQCVLEHSRPVIVDADGLNLLASRFTSQDTTMHRDDWILTPHPGEAARLLNCSVAEVEADRPGAARQLQQRFGGVVVLKGAGTLICGPRGLALCPYGNPGMASGGTGDVLTGFIAGLVAQGLELEQAAQCAVLVHALAGDHAASQAGERGLLASDLAFCARILINPTMGEDDVAATR